MDNNTNKLIPELRFPEFVGEWEEMNLESAVTFSSGGTPSKNIEEYWNGDIPWISASSMHNSFVEKSESNITSLAVENGASIAKKVACLFL